MGANLQISDINTILPKIIEKEGLNLTIAQARFYKRMQAAREKQMINPGGLFTNYLTLENRTGFGVAEGGPILSGGTTESTQGSINLRQLWMTIQWTGSLERIKSAYLIDFKQNPTKYDAKLQGMSNDALNRYATNLMVKTHVSGSLRQFGHMMNFFALQGTDKSAIGVVTDVPVANGGTLAAQTVGFSWNTTNAGNRFFAKNQQIEFRSPGGAVRSGGVAAGYVTVDQMVDQTPANAATGPVHFDGVPTDVAVGDTAHLRNSYGLLPQGVLYYVDAATNFKSIPVSTNPAIFSSVVVTLTGSPTIAPIHLRDLESQIQSKVGYDTPLELEYWMNKCLMFDWESQIYNSPFTRFIGKEKVKDWDMGVGEAEWNGKRFNIDVHVPPSHVNALNMTSWGQLVQTKPQAYEFNSGDYVVNQLNSSGQYLDARMSTVFYEGNWDLDDRRGQGRIEGFNFNPKYI